MAQALYRKYRSKKLSEVVGQVQITSTLQKALKSGRISHAYLFSGPRGVGKTSVARILAHEINNLDYKDDTIHLDIIEIDAASNRRIDEIRDLREKVHIAPTSAKYKVYIIDEAHMLTREAFNALLKTLEEPPEHCVFILATTEVHKLPETIVSRTQHYSFKPIENQAVKQHLSALAKKESIDIDSEALALMAKHGQGSFRDSISLLDQLSAFGGKITVEQVRQFLGLPPDEQVAAMLEHIDSGNLKALVAQLQDMTAQGLNSVAIAKSLSELLRQRLLKDQTVNPRTYTNLLKELLEVTSSNSPKEQLEIALLAAAQSNYSPANPKVASPQANSPSSAEIIEPPKNVKPTGKKPTTAKFELSSWDEILDAVKNNAASIYTALRLANPSLEGNTLTLEFRFGLHKKKLSTSANIHRLESIIKEVTGAKVKVECVLNSQPAKVTKPAEPEAKSDDVQAISNIFGSAEVLES